MKSTSTISPSVKYGLHFIGLWPGTPFPALHKFYWITSMATIQIYQYRYIIQHFQSDSLMQTIDNFCIALVFTLMSIKLIITWVNHGVLCDILSTMEDECRKYAAIDMDNSIFKTAHLSQWLTTTIIFSYVISVFFYVIGFFVSEYNNDTLSRSFHLKMDLPVATKETPVYELVLTAQFLHQTSTAFSFGTFSALLLMVVLHVGCQVDIMCQTITEDRLKNKEQLKFFINRHQDIILLTERIEKLFTYAALSQLLSNTLNTCCLGFLIVIAFNIDNGLPILIKSILFYVVVWLDAYLYCFAGEYLSTKSKLICETAYKCLWYDLHPNESQLLVLPILRSQKGLKLTFGKFSSLSLESFMSMMKASASYMSVLLAMS
ncbi:odorant receptor 4-like [Megachile rotundata]|uniref:odorant receptor 4-like n=1 Tax=Megachile rotundata TaxID=143995 RepID=UPI003FCEFE13